MSFVFNNNNNNNNLNKRIVNERFSTASASMLDLKPQKANPNPAHYEDWSISEL